MKTTENKKLREFFNVELINYSDSIFNQILSHYDSDCCVILTEEILNFLEEIKTFDIYDFINNYSSAIGETVYISFYGDSIFPLDKFKQKLKEMDLENIDYGSDLSFYTMYDIKDLVINSISDNKGFMGVIDTFSHIEYENFELLFIYSLLKMKNHK